MYTYKTVPPKAHATEAARLSSEAALRRAHEEAIAAVRQEAEATTAQRLDALVKRIVRDSETLKAEVALHTQVAFVCCQTAPCAKHRRLCIDTLKSAPAYCNKPAAFETVFTACASPGNRTASAGAAGSTNHLRVA